ncbi:hypothetical protein G3G77_004765 [Salmonella enterica]|nr:hypothetical protein [Salmonella enterica]EEH5466697.1 hypothetical protein [Salmonella enterica]EEH7556017.1 hypothetical protein [Salmonella enterica]EEO5640214.1 hypothetical protein [Salmonella enterica]EEQ0204186.1 hypothetical protein [Salmonella enterica]
MRQPYHPLTHQVVESTDEDEELTEDEKLYHIAMIRKLIRRVAIGFVVSISIFSLLCMLVVSLTS